MKGIVSNLKTDIDWLYIPTICIGALLQGRETFNLVGFRIDKVALVPMNALIVFSLLWFEFILNYWWREEEIPSHNPQSNPMLVSISFLF